MGWVLCCVYSQIQGLKRAQALGFGNWGVGTGTHCALKIG